MKVDYTKHLLKGANNILLLSLLSTALPEASSVFAPVAITSNVSSVEPECQMTIPLLCSPSA